MIDIKALTIESPALVSQLGPAFEKYNEEQFATVKLPGSSQFVCLDFADFGKNLADAIFKVIVSSHNSLGNGRYFDVESSSSFTFDHTTQASHHGRNIIEKGLTG
jgi:hypothetical protein